MLHLKLEDPFFWGRGLVRTFATVAVLGFVCFDFHVGGLSWTVAVVCILRCQNGGMKDAVSRAVTGLSGLPGEANCMR